MKRMILFFSTLLPIFSDGVAITPEQFAKDFLESNIELQMQQSSGQSAVHELESNWGRYIPRVYGKGSISEDKSDPLMPQLPHHLKQQSTEVGLETNTSYGVGINLGVKQDWSTQTVNTAEMERARSEVFGKVSIDLLKNIGGRIDRKQQSSWTNSQELSTIQLETQKDYLLFQALSLFAQYNYLKEQRVVTEEIEKNAQMLVTLADKRNRQGLKNQRDQLIYRSNLSSIKNSLLAIDHRLIDLRSQLGSIMGKEGEESDFHCPLNLINAPMVIPSLTQTNRQTQLFHTQLEVAANEKDVADYQLLPDLKIIASWQGIGNQEQLNDSWDDSLGRNKERQAIELQLTMPLSFSAEREKLSSKMQLRKKASDQIRQAEIDHRQNNQELQQRYQLSQQKIEAAKRHRENENEKYLNELQEFKKGMRNTMDLVQFQNDYLKAKLMEAEVYWERFNTFNQLLLENDSLKTEYSKGNKIWK